ncbi:hypothetical protein [Spirosoma fluviale]|uniref:Uncharacterized protein n=1 Tax=Spirosoma fluviale TaxID=1597977 RepID=A0A286G299_9BACT|nr:hypothetical protein [Spirosoma fluviale]SOD89670.1 hypothetical protein SAMN06269250_3151 [Spirosoma fluviale]
MVTFLTSLQGRNAVLYQLGWLCVAAMLFCTVLALTTQTQVLGINAYIKPIKFLASTAILAWTMAWYLAELPQSGSIKAYAWMFVVVFAIELGIIIWQASRGKLSHFNIATPIDGLLFSLMGIAITVFTLWTAYIGFLFFRLDTTAISPAYLWGIRLGILLFVVFAFQGFMMAGRLAHTVGAPDGGPGLAVLNWSTRYGDLRVAHFLGMHALQLIPLFAYYVATSPRQVFLVSAVYFIVVTALLVQALAGKPLLAGLGN